MAPVCSSQHALAEVRGSASFLSRTLLVTVIVMSHAFSDLRAVELTARDEAIEARVEALLAQMTLREKIGQLSQRNVGVDHIPDPIREAIADGKIGSVLNAVGPELTAELQRIAVQESRLGIPLLIGRDVIHGFRTVFPIPLGQAASFHPDGVREGARLAALEAVANGVNWTFAPMIDISRDARWGRIAESFGEDPFLTSVLAVASVEGYQGEDLGGPGRIAATAKHFAGYGASESGRDYNTTNIPENELRNVYLPPFRAAVDAGVASLMASFSDIDGVPASANRWLMRDVLRDEWGFRGLVVSDWESISQLTIHGLTADGRGAAAEAMNAGIDMEMQSATYEHFVEDLVEDGRLSTDTIDEMVRNVLRVKFHLGIMDAVPDPDAVTVDLEAHLEATRVAARESLVLLKNDGDVLPLDADAVRTLAVIGPLADAPYDQLGTWIFDGDRALAVTPLQALRDELGDAVDIRYVPTLATSRTRDQSNFEAALDAVRAADAVLLFLGEESILSGEAHSRADIQLPGAQEALVEAVAAIGKPTAAVILAGRPLALQNVVDDLPAILYAWHPGTMGGPAIVDVVFGAESPSGKLPVTFPRMSGQVPIYYNHKNTGKPATVDSFVPIDEIPPEAPQLSVGNTAHHLDAGFTPLFPFGHGLGYTTFAYDDLVVRTPRVALDGVVEVEATVRNTGQRPGIEVVQLYIRDLVGNVTRPVRELKGFQRIRLEPGQSRTVRFALPTDALAFYGRDMQRRIEAGAFHVWIGGSSATTLRAGFELVDAP